jgi:CheY-like chemotaxis protein
VFAVTPAEHGQHALELLAGRQVDAILTDLQMPVMDGLTLLGHLLQRGVRTPVAVMTGQHITAELAERLQRYGIAATFTKPVELTALADELQRCLSPATVGRIAGITLFGFLQLLEVERKTGLIIVHSAGQEGRLYFERGALVHAETRRLGGVAAVNDIVGWSDPRLEIFYKRTTRERTIQEPLQHILLEAARLLDERGQSLGAAAAGGPATEARPEVGRALDEAMQIEGALGVALVDGTSGLALGVAGDGAALSVEPAAAGAADVVQALAALGGNDPLEDVMITLGKRYHLIRFVGSERQVFLYLVLDRGRANLGMARHRLAAIARRLVL